MSSLITSQYRVFVLMFFLHGSHLATINCIYSHVKQRRLKQSTVLTIRSSHQSNYNLFNTEAEVLFMQ